MVRVDRVNWSEIVCHTVGSCESRGLIFVGEGVQLVSILVGEGVQPVSILVGEGVQPVSILVGEGV